MIHTAILVGLKLRWVPPTVFLFGSAPVYCVVVGAVRLIGLPFGSRVVNSLEDLIYACYQSLTTLCFDVLSGVKIIHYGDKMLPENAIYLSNHQCTADWAMVEVMTIRHGAWGFSRYILKDSLKYFPLYGLSLWMHGCMFVRRRGVGVEKLSRDMQQLVKAGRPLWLVIFPEGTRYNVLKKHAIQKSQQYAKDNGIQPLAHLLTPRTSGFEVALKSIRDHVSSVYDITVVYEGPKKVDGRTPPPSMFSYFDGRCTKVHVHVNRIPIGDIPQDNEGQRQWLFQQYIKKDKMIGNMLNHGRFDGPPNIPSYPVFQLMIPSTVFVTMAAVAGYKYPSVRLLIAAVTGLYMIGGFVLFTTTTSY